MLTWNSTTTTDGSHTITAVARDAAGNQKTSTAVTVTVANDPTPPTVSITAPAAAAIVSGAAVSVTASAADNVGVVGVQFKLDGVNLGAEDTAASYGITWDTTQTSNGSHALTATARDAAGNRTTSAPVNVTVSNTIAPPPVGVAVDATAFADRSTSGTTITTSTFSTTTAGELLLAFISADDTSAGGQQVGGVSGAGLTWQLVVRTNAQRGTSEIWRAFAPSIVSSASVTATLAQSAASIAVVSFSGADPSGTSGSGAIGATKSASAASGAPTGSLVTTRNGSLVVGVGNDWDSNTSRTLGSGQTLVHQYLATVGDTFWVQRMSASTPAAGTTVTINDTAPTADRFNLSLCEILPASTTGDGTAPTVSVTAPIGGATVSGNSVNVTAAAADNVGVVGVQFKLDGVNLGSEDTTSPYGIIWDSTSATNVGHTLTAVARDAAGNTTTSAGVAVSVNNVDAGPPTVSFTAPANNATVSGSSVALSATAADDVAVVSVQFMLDNANLGAADTTVPYGATWNTTSAANGNHTLAAVARDAAGNTTTATITVTVSNAVATNLTVNGSSKSQQIDGFGVNLNPKLWNNGELIGGINQLVDVMGVNIVRVDALTNSWWELGNDDGNANNYNWAYYNRLFNSTNFQSVWNTIEYLSRRNVTVIFSAQGLLPAWMGGSVLNTAQEDEFAEMFSAAVYDGRVTRGLTFTLIDPMNEVDWNGIEGPQVSSAQYARVARKIVDRLTALGLTDIKVVPPEVASIANTSYVDAVVADSVLAAHVDVVGFHNYTGASPSLGALSGRRLWITEWSNGTTDGFLDGGTSVANEWNFARTEADYLLNHIRDGASAALKWDAIDNVHEHDPSGAETKWGSLAYDFTTHTMTPRKRLYASGLVFRFVRPGMSKISVSTTSGVTVYGFYDSTTGGVSLVGHNSSGSAVILNGSLANVGAVTTLNSYTTDSGNASITRGLDVAVTGATFSYAVPADTFFALTSGTATTPDAEAPVVSFVSPAGAGPFAGPLDIEVSATDNQAVTAVQFAVDGKAFDVVFDAPYDITVDTRFLANGNHSVTATVWDNASNSTSVSLPLSVSNASTKSLVAAYGFAENSGLAAVDSAGNVGDGFLNGAAWTAAGKFGAGLSFNGSGLVIVNDSPYLHLGTGMTMEAWVMPSSGVGKRAVIFKERQGIPSYALYSNNAAASSGPAQGRITDTLMNTTVISGATVSANSWTHLAVTHDGTNLRIYSNGVLSATAAAPAIFSTNGPLYIGGNVFQGDFFAGVIDEVRIYNRALSSQEILADMSTPIVADTTLPIVAVSSPADGATVAGANVTVSATASDNTAVVGVRFTVDGINLGNEVTTAPYSVAWNTTGLDNGTHVVAAIARDAAGNSASASVNVTVNNPPIVSGVAVSSITQTSATVSWTTNTLTDSAINYGLTSTYGSSTTLDPTLVKSHVQTITGLSPSTPYHFQVVSTDAVSNQAVSSDAVFTTAAPPDIVAPTVSISAPVAGATVSGTSVTITATAADNVGVVGVQFKLDGANLGAEKTTAPYTTVWNTSGVPNGSHILTAVARDAATNATTSADVGVTVSNAATSAISIDFVGTGTAMAATETAGVVARTNWNSATGASRSTSLALVTETGAASGAGVTWTSDNTWRTTIASTAGNLRMMKGYLDSGSGHATTVTVTGLAAGTYDIYVYVDGDNGSGTRSGTYQLSGAGITTTSVSLTDPANTNFAGTFTQAASSNGNYVKFSGVSATGFTLTATPATSSDTAKRAPVNAIQIIPR